MTLAGKFTDVLPDGQGAHLGGHVHVDSVSTHAPPGAIIVPDAHLLFTGDFKRSGVDLILSGDGRELVLHDYFKGEKRAPLASPDGAHLTGDIVNALTGHTQLAQADGSPSVAQVIGHVTKLIGTATAIRNGVSIILNNGDNVNKGDVVQSGSDSTLGITFIDGSVFGLASNAKMVLNEMIYDPNGSSNSSLISLVQGTISFVAGGTAKKGDMKVDTPVATMGIRGTAVLVEIDFEVPGQGGAPPAKFQVLVEPDGTTGSYILFDKTTLTPIATVNQAGTQTIVSGQGTVNFLSSVQLSPDAQKIISDVFALKFTDLNNPQSLQRFGSYADFGNDFPQNGERARCHRDGEGDSGCRHFRPFDRRHDLKEAWIIFRAAGRRHHQCRFHRTRRAYRQFRHRHADRPDQLFRRQRRRSADRAGDVQFVQIRERRSTATSPRR